VLAESAQGALRRVLSSPDVEFAVRQASVITGALVIFAITWFCMRWMKLRSATRALAVGLLWVAMTVAFELALGRAMALGWERRLIPLELAAMALTPWLVRRLLGAR
jgi:hypothetical protein